MKKKIVFLLSACLLASPLVSCGGGGSSSADSNLEFSYLPKENGYEVTGIKYKATVSKVDVPNSFDDGVHGSHPIVSIRKRAFGRCDALVSVTLPDTVVSIGDQAFYACRSLESINLPNDLVSIGYDTFGWCGSISKMDIPDGTKSIGGLAFYCCGSLSSLTVGNNLTSLGDGIIEETSVLGDLWGKIEGGVYLTSRDGSTKYLVDYFEEKTKSPFVIDPKTRVIASGLFSRDSLENVSLDIPDSVVGIGDSAFSAGSHLESITIGNNVESIGFRPFYNTPFWNDENKRGSDGSLYLSSRDGSTKYLLEFPTSGTSYSVDEGTKVVATSALYNGNPETVTSISIPKTVISIPSFFTRSNVSSITVEEGNPKYHSKNNCLIETETKTLVAGCIGSIIPDDGSVVAIGYMAFAGSSIESISIPKNVVSIGERAFTESALSSISFSSDMSYFGYEAFDYCANLKTIVIPEKVVRIEEAVFRSCDSLESVNIGNGVKSIAASAFGMCESLSSISIPESVVTIEESAFEGCSSLESIEIGKSIKSIGDYAFTGTKYVTNTNNWRDGALYLDSSDHEVKYLLYANKVSSCSIENGTRVIANKAFVYKERVDNVDINNTTLTSVTIPNSVITIGSEAFSYCESLTSIVIPNSVIEIGANAFEGCHSLSSIEVEGGNAKYHSVGNCLIETESKTLLRLGMGSEIPNDGSVLSIASYAFYGESSMTSIVIPLSVVRIGSSAFANIRNFRIYSMAPSKPDAWSVFDIGRECTYYYYSEAENADGSHWHYVNNVPTVWGE